MDRSAKIALAFFVVFGGTVAALSFRREAHQPRPSEFQAGQTLVLRNHPGSASADRDGTEGNGDSRMPGEESLPSAQPITEAARILRPLESGEPPPLARVYPDTSVPETSRWGTSIGLGLPPAARSVGSLRTHKIADGDTLEALAERYLGSAERSQEIYEANRDSLPSPQLLPIGAELRIPSGDGDRAIIPAEANPGMGDGEPPAGGGASERPLVPIRQDVSAPRLEK
ncbi:MAG: LysM peptidoglycan-binding domain-containing protein [Pirellulales bacterium]|nr:LysM peptidoglycan-binding domain-containing protein [Pirellulales bacterium]